MRLSRSAAKIEARSPLKAEATRIAATNATPLARASAALRLVQQDARYIYVGLGARAGFDVPAKATSTTIMRGVKGLQQQVQLSVVTPDQLLAALRQNFTGSTWQTVGAVKWRYDEKAQASILTVSGTWNVDWENDGGSARSLALPGGGFSPPDKRIYVRRKLLPRVRAPGWYNPHDPRLPN